MNVVALVGRLTRDMEFGNPVTTKSNKTLVLARGTIAVERKGSPNKEVDFIPVQSWITATQRDKYHGPLMKKGALISINGVVIVENYEKDGVSKVFTSIQGETQLMSPSRNEGENQAAPQQGGFNQNEYNQGGFNNQNEYNQGGFNAIEDEDIPF